MEKLIKNAFNDAVMPNSCSERIEKALTSNTKKPRHVWRLLSAVAAACLLVVIMIAGNPGIAKALEIKVAEIAAYFGFSGNVTSTYRSDDGNYTIVKGRTPEGYNYATGSYDTGSTPGWLSEVNGRLYFTGNQENIDITDLISNDDAFTYSYTDSRGILHYIAVGGVYDPDPELNDIGWGEWMRKALEVEANPDAIYAGWIGGYGSNHWNNETDDYYGWYASALEIMNIPWG